MERQLCTAVFFIKYLRILGFSANNDIFAENAWYFRNALVRANYTNLQKGIYETTEYLEAFLRNLLLNEKNKLHNRNLHISGLLNEEKVDKENINLEGKMSIRKAEPKDFSRIAEIFVFNNRINYLPIFKDESYSFGELQVVSFIEQYLKNEEVFQNLYVYDDGLVKGFLQMKRTEVCKLYVEPGFQREGIGHDLMELAIKEFGADHLWALEKNERAIAFYNRHGFYATGKRQFEEGTTEYLIELKRKD